MDLDESVLWSGRPDPKSLYFPKYELLPFCFGIGISLITTVLFVVVLFMNVDEPILIAFTILFPLAGFFIALPELRRAIQRRDSTEYVITNKRIFRRTGIRVDVFCEGIADGYETILHRNGNATIRFPMVIEPNAGSVRVNGRAVIQNFLLANITDIEAVHRALSNMDTTVI